MKDRSDDPSHHARTLLPRSYISLPCYYSDNKKKRPTDTLDGGRDKGTYSPKSDVVGFSPRLQLSSDYGLLQPNKMALPIMLYFKTNLI